jgi:hypothetical protein
MNMTQGNSGPLNPLEKPGWNLVAHDEFDGPELDESLWIPEYFPGRFEIPKPAAYYFKDGAIHIAVNDPTVERLGEYQSVSSIQTFNCHNLHHTYALSSEAVPTIDKFTQLYGWYEVRAKHVGPMHHIAFWMLEAQAGGSEIDVIEGPSWPMPNWHQWANPHEFPEERKIISGYDKITTKEQRATEFHLYALEVFPEGARIYHDNQLIEEGKVDWKKRGEVPLMFFLGIYGSHDPEDRNEKQEYVVDYFRAYEREADN